MTKEQIQQKAVEDMREARLLVLQWATSLGKSKAAIDIIKDIRTNRRCSIHVLLVVAELAHIDNWKEEFKRWEVSINTCVITTYASLKHFRNNNYDLIILDEAHHAGSEMRLEILGDIKAGKVLALSATMPTETLLYLQRIYEGLCKVSKYTLQDAIDLGILPKPSVYLIPMILNNENPTQILIEEWGSGPKKKTIKCKYKDIWEYRRNKSKYPDIRLEVSCTEFQKYFEINAKMEYWRKLYMRTRNEGVKNKWLQLGSERKRFLGSLKEHKAKELLSLIGDKRFICFCSSIEQAESLGGINSIHSKKENSLEIIMKFNKKKIDNLFAVGMLQEGQNLVDIQAGVIIQLDGKERSFIQKMGRAMRADNPLVFIMYYKYTQDERYLEQAIEGLDSDLIEEIINVKDLKL